MLLYIDTPALFSSVVGISYPVLSQIIEIVTEKRRSMSIGCEKTHHCSQYVPAAFRVERL